MGKTFETDSGTMATMGNKVMDNAGQIAGEVESLIGRLESVDWKGSAATSFHGAKENWRAQVTTIKQELEDVAERLGVSSKNYDATHVAVQTGYEHLRGQNLPI